MVLVLLFELAWGDDKLQAADRQSRGCYPWCCLQGGALAPQQTVSMLDGRQ